ncbi:MAG: LemA family protein [Lactovum sp.]
MVYILIILVLIIFFVIWLFWHGRNKLVRLSVNVDEASSQINTQLQRRYDLLPNLVETVKAYAKYESETFEKITKARNSLAQALNAADPELLKEADIQFQQAQFSIQLVAEKYPDLKASENFLNLQEELTTTENKIAYARQAFNDSVREYNTEIQVFPIILIAEKLGFKERQMFELSSEEAREVVEVGV